MSLHPPQIIEPSELLGKAVPGGLGALPAVGAFGILKSSLNERKPPLNCVESGRSGEGPTCQDVSSS